MRAIFAQSPDGVMARGTNDNMKWTGAFDKQIFKLITVMNGGTCFVSKNTAKNMPGMLKGRTLKTVSSKGYSLLDAELEHPNGTLIGGPTLLKTAYDLGILSEIIVCTIKDAVALKPLNDRLYFNPFMYSDIKLPPALMTLDFDEVLVDIYRLKIELQPDIKNIKNIQEMIQLPLKTGLMINDRPCWDCPRKTYGKEDK